MSYAGTDYDTYRFNCTRKGLNMATIYRCFFALELPDDMVDGLCQIIAEQRPRCPDATWTSSEKLHITLGFMPEADPVRIDEVVQQVAHMHYRFDLALNGAGVFMPHSPRVLWLSTDSNSSRKITSISDDLCASMHIKKPENLHLTLAKIEHGSGKKFDFNLLTVRNDINNRVMSVTAPLKGQATHIGCYQGGNGNSYKVLAREALQGR